ncbi:MAG: hypothetical protein AB7O62_23315 [Pirellulales bacterium]
MTEPSSAEPGSPFQFAGGVPLGSGAGPTMQVAFEYQYRKDSEHLSLLSIFYFVMGGLSLFGVIVQCAMFAFFETVLAAMMTAPQGPSGPPPKEVMAVMTTFMASIMAIVVAVSLLQGVLNVMCGLFLRKRQYRTFSLVVAGINCLQVPFGLALGVFTFVVLLRDSVKRLYEERESPA